MKRWHVTPIFCLLLSASFAQINLTAGYTLSFLDAPGQNGVIAAHEATLSESYRQHFKQLNVLHGLDLGLEYRWDSFALQAGWRVKRNRQEGSGTHTSVPFTNKLEYSMASFYTAAVQYLGPVRLSASIDYNYIRNKVNFQQPAVETVFKDNSWGSEFSMGLVLQGSGPVALLVAPFVQFNWANYDLGPMQTALTEIQSGPVHEDYFNYGIGIYFLNGPKRKT